jgi:hypothetical protein
MIVQTLSMLMCERRNMIMTAVVRADSPCRSRLLFSVLQIDKQNKILAVS